MSKISACGRPPKGGRCHGFENRLRCDVDHPRNLYMDRQRCYSRAMRGTVTLNSKDQITKVTVNGTTTFEKGK